MSAADLAEPAPASRALTDEPWFWVVLAVVGVGVIGGGVAIGVAATSHPSNMDPFAGYGGTTQVVVATLSW